ncbi:MAG: hypothetical protein K6T59_17465, partial [Bryobacteraceae bacterium]|nr:hypothetical protein [Bryobacteraceae bacterium]
NPTGSRCLPVGLRLTAISLAGIVAFLGADSRSIPRAFAHPGTVAQRKDTHTQRLWTPVAAVMAASRPKVAAPLVAKSGWFHVVWNGGPRYLLVDDRGGWTRLLLDEEIAKPFGGPLGLRGKRVKVIGVYVPEPAGALRVHCIKVEPRDSTR